jgi:hypothetical protein
MSLSRANREPARNVSPVTVAPRKRDVPVASIGRHEQMDFNGCLLNALPWLCARLDHYFFSFGTTEA